jgi:plastocyanin
MRHTKWILAATFFSLAACGSVTSYGGGSGGGGGGGGGGPSGQIVVGNILFRSAHNGSQNPAVDTVAVGSTVTWTWTATGTTSHSVQSAAAPNFTNSAIQSGNGKTYSVTFPTAGTYQYDCAVHGSAMRGTIVVQ